MTDRLPDAEVRRARFHCYLAAAVFAGCGVLLAVMPFEIAAAVRWVLAGFNGIVALAVFLYGRQLTEES